MDSTFGETCRLVKLRNSHWCGCAENCLAMSKDLDVLMKRQLYCDEGTPAADVECNTCIWRPCPCKRITLKSAGEVGSFLKIHLKVFWIFGAKRHASAHCLIRSNLQGISSDDLPTCWHCVQTKTIYLAIHMYRYLWGTNTGDRAIDGCLGWSHVTEARTQQEQFSGADHGFIPCISKQPASPSWPKIMIQSCSKLESHPWFEPEGFSAFGCNNWAKSTIQGHSPFSAAFSRR